MKKFRFTLVLALPLFLAACNTGTPTDVNAPEIEVEVDLPNAETGTPPAPRPEGEENQTGMETDENAMVFDLSNQGMKFVMDGVENPELKVKEGDTVTINFTSQAGLHDWKIDEFNAATQQVQADNTSSVTFVADKKGSFEYYCSVGNHREQGMKGTLIVE